MNARTTPLCTLPLDVVFFSTMQLQRDGNEHWGQRDSDGGRVFSSAGQQLDRLLRRENGPASDRHHHSILLFPRVRRQIPLLSAQEKILLSGMSQG